MDGRKGDLALATIERIAVPGPQGDINTPKENLSRKEKAMQKNQRVSEMASEALERQAEARTKWNGEELEEAFKAVVETEAGRKLLELRNAVPTAMS